MKKLSLKEAMETVTECSVEFILERKKKTSMEKLGDPDKVRV